MYGKIAARSKFVLYPKLQNFFSLWFLARKLRSVNFFAFQNIYLESDFRMDSDQIGKYTVSFKASPFFRILLGGYGLTNPNRETCSSLSTWSQGSGGRALWSQGSGGRALWSQGSAGRASWSQGSGGRALWSQGSGGRALWSQGSGGRASWSQGSGERALLAYTSGLANTRR